MEQLNVARKTCLVDKQYMVPETKKLTELFYEESYHADSLNNDIMHKVKLFHYEKLKKEVPIKKKTIITLALKKGLPGDLILNKTIIWI